MATLKFRVFVPVSCVIALAAAAGFKAEDAMKNCPRRWAAPRRRLANQTEATEDIELVEMAFAMRPMLPSDSEQLVRGMAQLMSRKSLFLRFMRPVDGLSSGELKYLTDLDYWDRFAWALCILVPSNEAPPSQAGSESPLPGGVRELGVAVARYIRVQDTGVGSYNAVRSDPYCAEAAMQAIASSLEASMERSVSSGTPQDGTLQPTAAASAHTAAQAPDTTRQPGNLESSSGDATAQTALLKGFSPVPMPRASVSLPAIHVASPVMAAAGPSHSGPTAPPTPRGKSASATAELAVTVADCFHQCGFATLLLWALSQVAMRHGVRHFVGVSHEDNFKVRKPPQTFARLWLACNV
jgi:hypothetical protein